MMQIEKDKQYHMIAGAAVAFIFGAIFTAMDFRSVWLLMLAMSLFAGVAKEAADYVSNRWNAYKNLPPVHTIDSLDVAYTVLGGAIPAVLVLLHQVMK